MKKIIWIATIAASLLTAESIASTNTCYPADYVKALSYSKTVYNEYDRTYDVYFCDSANICFVIPGIVADNRTGAEKEATEARKTISDGIETRPIGIYKGDTDPLSSKHNICTYSMDAYFNGIKKYNIGPGPRSPRAGRMPMQIVGA